MSRAAAAAGPHTARSRHGQLRLEGGLRLHGVGVAVYGLFVGQGRGLLKLLRRLHWQHRSVVSSAPNMPERLSPKGWVLQEIRGHRPPLRAQVQESGQDQAQGPEAAILVRRQPGRGPALASTGRPREALVLLEEATDKTLEDMRILMGEWQRGEAHGVEDDAEGPHVTLLCVAVRTLHEELRSRVLHSPGVATRRYTSGGLTEGRGGAEVAEHGAWGPFWHPVGPLQEDVGRLEITVKDALSMQVLQPEEDVQKEMPDLGHGQWLLWPAGISFSPDELIQRAAVAVLHEDEEEGDEGAEWRAARELKPRVLVLDDVGVV
mmetsp:Transcript_9991/g.22945  ORF Transcript_9991/g.22945 Transcript_9991/m.22945 type:complete len:320 (-) Transcript_9991:698-1657(-)